MIVTCLWKDYEIVTKAEEATGVVLQKKTYSFSKKRLWCRCFPVNFAKFFKNTCFTEHLRASASAKVRVPIEPHK